MTLVGWLVIMADNRVNVICARTTIVPIVQGDLPPARKYAEHNPASGHNEHGNTHIDKPVKMYTTLAFVHLEITATPRNDGPINLYRALPPGLHHGHTCLRRRSARWHAAPPSRVSDRIIVLRVRRYGLHIRLRIARISLYITAITAGAARHTRGPDIIIFGVKVIIALYMRLTRWHIARTLPFLIHIVYHPFLSFLNRRSMQYI